MMLLALLLALAAGFQQKPAGSATEQMYRSAAASAERKLQHIQENGRRTRPDQTPTVLTENEVNAYFASGKVRLPQGVKSVVFHGNRGVIDAVARVDFDEITAARRSANPLLMLFRGVHDVRVVANAQASGGTAEVHVQSVEIDGVTVPRRALEYFIDRYIKPKYPEVGLESRFKLSHRIDTATVGNGELTVTQK